MARSEDAEQVEAVVRAVRVLEAFGEDASRLSLAELSRRLALPKTSVLRVARTLAAHGYLAPVEGGAWRLGPATSRLSARYRVAFDVHNLIEPAMRALAAATRQSVSYFVPDGDARVRLLHVTGRSRSMRPLQVGETKPLDKGSPGQVLLAFSGAKGRLYEEIRRRGFHVTIGEASPVSASVAAPVYGPSWRVVGALCIGMPAGEASEEKLSAFAPRLLRAADKLSRALVADAQASRLKRR